MSYDTSVLNAIDKRAVDYFSQTSAADTSIFDNTVSKLRQAVQKCRHSRNNDGRGYSEIKGLPEQKTRTPTACHRRLDIPHRLNHRVKRYEG